MKYVNGYKRPAADTQRIYFALTPNILIRIYGLKQLSSTLYQGLITN
jgi:hypothetical protein